jgi:adenosylhomocysteine nucleosidase
LQKVASTPCVIYRGEYVILAIGGVGKANAAAATAYCCALFHPTWVLNVGAAGATDSRCALGGFFHISRTFEPDRPHIRTKEPYVQTPETLPGFEEAMLATHDRPIIECEDRQHISSCAGLVDMEGAAVVQTAHQFGVPCLLFKFVSDTPDDIDISHAIAYMRQYGKGFAMFVFEEVLPRIVLATPVRQFL